MTRTTPDGSRTPLSIPNHRMIKSPILRSICTQARISRDDFLAAYEKA